MFKIKFLYGTFVLIPFLIQGAASNHLNVELHFDVNKTILGSDDTQGKNTETTVNGILAEFTFEEWNGTTKQSYYAYVTDQIALENPQLVRASQDFKALRQERLKNFEHDLKRFPTAYDEHTKTKARIAQVLVGEGPVIFPSFFETIEWLNIKFPGQYTIYLRTFGSDLPAILPIIERKANIQFIPGTFVDDKLVLCFNRAMLLKLMTSPAHLAIQDDYDRWKESGFKAIGGKLFPIKGHPNSIEMFFDDNADDSVKPIVCPMYPDGTLADTKKLLESGQLVAVNPKEAMLEKDYFVKKITHYVSSKRILL